MKKKLKIIGAILFLLGLVLGIIGPGIVCEAQSTGKTQSARSKIKISNNKRTIIIMGLSGILFGAGLALVITGTFLKETHNRE